jgi:carbon storage regulator
MQVVPAVNVPPATFTEETTMLVLTRKVGETIVINDNVRVTVIQQDRGKVRLAIAAPPEVRILRSELAERLKTTSTGYTFDEANDTCSAR